MTSMHIFLLTQALLCASLTAQNLTFIGRLAHKSSAKRLNLKERGTLPADIRVCSFGI